MKDLVSTLSADAAFAAVLPRAGAQATIGSVLGASAALCVAAARDAGAATVLVVVSDPEEAERFALDLQEFGAPATLLPPRGAQPDRLRARLDAVDGTRRLVVAPLLALLEPLPAEASVRASVLSAEVGGALSATELVRRLVGAGLERVPLVARPGELSLRGELLDFWPRASDVPIRIETFDGRVDSIRRFDATTQRSIERLERIAVPLVGDSELDGRAPLDAFAAESLVVFVDPVRIQDRGDGLGLQNEALRERFAGFLDGCRLRARLDLRLLPGGDLDLGARSVREMGVGLRPSPDVLEAAARERRVIVHCATKAEAERLRQVLRDRGTDPSLPIEVRVGELSRGFVLPRVGVTALTHAELAGVVAVRRPSRARKIHTARAIETAAELHPGDLVVHAVHGIGRFLRTERLRKGPGEEDHLVIEFAEETKLYVPASRIDLVGKYLGAGRAAPPLDRIGGVSFARRKAQVKKAVADLAAELLEVHAMRETRTGFACPSDDDLQLQFEAAFPFEDTDDQVSVTVELKTDLEAPRPMDRLLCGDVGYGKTELSMRAAFKIVQAGRQVAVLVPTTVLAQQHLDTFRGRFADFPVTVDVVSRFRTDREVREVLRRAREGTLDVLIGTHRLLSKDVVFRDLGLVVIDEEQRFGVRAKERLKRLRATVDVLSMTATPIPRTLHQALVGLRDISSLTTPPPGREAVETHAGDCEDDALVQEALRREINRGGQVYFVHNRIASLEHRTRQLAALVPEARYALAHGRMGDDALEETMTAFVRGEFDVLVSTSIVESGLDIPRANTIFLDHAEWFGLADLHQLRGRVGRGGQKAYCFLLTSRSQPLGADARARLRAIEELQQLGSGFDIAMKDLEIRGAGNLLGAEQSGHIAAVGYDLYCRLLRATVDRMSRERKRRAARELAAAAQLGIPAPEPRPRDRVTALSEEDAAALADDRPVVVERADEQGAARAEIAVDDARGIPLPKMVAGASADEEEGVDLETGVRAFLPESWVPESSLRLDIYRAMDGVKGRPSYDAVAADLRDRFGRLPPEVWRLLDLFLVKNRLAGSTARLIVYAKDRYQADVEDRRRFESHVSEVFRDRRWIDEGRVHLVFPGERELAPDDALDLLVRAVSGPSGPPESRPVPAGARPSAAPRERPARRGRW